MIREDEPTGSLRADNCPVNFDEYVEIQARLIVSQMVFKHQNRLIEQRNRDYDQKMNELVDKTVSGTEEKQREKNVKDMKVKSILRKPAFFSTKTDFDIDSKDEI